MKYYAFTTDYDGTLAFSGRVDQNTLESLGRLRASGRKLVLVTGRQLDDLLRVFPQIDSFDRVVAENGAVLYRPDTREEKLLAHPPSDQLINALRKKKIDPLSMGRVIVATYEPHETTLLNIIRDLGLEMQLIFNKGTVMILPSGVNKATGLRAALDELGLSPHNAVAVGDAENDHAFLTSCECAVAVADALPSIKADADLVTSKGAGVGAVEVIERLIATDLKELEPKLSRHAVLLGNSNGEKVLLPSGASALICGASGGGKSTFATGLIERAAEKGYQFCVIDPEGDYQGIGEAAVLGSGKRVPLIEEVLKILESPHQNAVVNLLGVRMEDRPLFFEELLAALLDLRARKGRPHWIVLDEAHHLFPASRTVAQRTVPTNFNGMILITIHPSGISPVILKMINLIVALGENQPETIQAVGKVLKLNPPSFASAPPNPSEAIAWWQRPKEEPFRLELIPMRAERRRHLRKYAEGELGPDKSFYFRGPRGKLNLRAQNLTVFLQLADGVDDATWEYHLRRGDYSRWFREMIKDETLAEDAERIERKADRSAKKSRLAIREMIEARYTGPA
jgi:HAD superfamily hydrolase (TIGR01484 family)